MEAEKIEWLRGYAHKMNCKLEIDGEVGFGRQCVGLIQNDPVSMPSYLSYGWYGMSGDEEANKEISSLVHNVAPELAYHKGDYIAVLGEGFAALEELYNWCVELDKLGLVTELVDEADFGEGTSTMSLMLYGKRAQIRRLCYKSKEE